MKNISQLIPDIYNLVQTKGWFSDEIRDEFSSEVGRRLQEKFGENERAPSLRLSKMGPSCPKALWASINRPEEAEALPPWAEIKYSYGHILEALAIALAKAAGHTVEGEQDELFVDGIKGHRDCVIDGCVVDVKSSSSIAFNKFKDGSIGKNDSFGYLDQLDGYLVGSYSDPLVRVKDKGYLLVIDKQLGHMCLYEHHIRENSIRERIALYRSIVSLPSPPKCECGTVPDGSSGNIRLDVKASYNPYKYFCFPRLRTFLYAGGPRYLTKVERKPDVPEVDRYRQTVYRDE